MAELEPEYVEWCGSHFALMAQDGVWAVPRSGLLFQRHGERLALIDRMPFSEELIMTIASQTREVPTTPEDLQAYQDADFLTIRHYFEAAGISVDYLPFSQDPAERISA